MKKTLFYFSLMMIFSGVLLSSFSVLYSVTDTSNTIENDKCLNPLSSQDVIDCANEPIVEEKQSVILTTNQKFRIVSGVLLLFVGVGLMAVSLK